MKNTIRKIKNFEGYCYSCTCCGRELMHAYTINGKGNYGSQCAKNLGYGKQIKKQDNIMKALDSQRINEPSTYKAYCEAYGSEADYIEKELSRA